MYVLDRKAGLERVADVPNALRIRGRELLRDFVDGRGRLRTPTIGPVAPEAEPADFEAAKGFLQALLERPADRHRFADRFHLRRQGWVGLGELLEIEAGNLRHHVIDRRLEAGRSFPRDVISQFVER